MTAVPRLRVPIGDLPLDSGLHLSGVDIGVETYGRLSASGDNVVLVCHSLTHDAHAAGDAKGWWSSLIGAGKTIDTTRWFVVCVDSIATGRSTGPWTSDPRTGARYGMRFPTFTVRDVVRAHHAALGRLGVHRVRLVVGGCFGGQQALEHCISFPETTGSCVAITVSPQTSAHTVLLFAVMRALIQMDPAWNDGDYYDGPFPDRGLHSALVAGLPVWISPGMASSRFGRTFVVADSGDADGPMFAAEEFVAKIARSRRPIDANGLLYLMRAVQMFDLENEYGSIEAASAKIGCPVTLVSFDTDWRYPPAEAERLRDAICAAGGCADHLVVHDTSGHGAFIANPPTVSEALERALRSQSTVAHTTVR